MWGEWCGPEHPPRPGSLRPRGPGGGGGGGEGGGPGPANALEPVCVMWWRETAFLPFVRAFYGKPSTYIWEDDVGDVHQIVQGEGGEQGDPLMPLLFCIGQHPALAAVAKELREGEKLFAYQDDLYIICQPDRVGEVHALSQKHLWNYTGISLHSGKTKIWNRSGVEPAGVSELQRQAEVATPGATVWRGDPSLPTSRCWGCHWDTQTSSSVSCSGKSMNTGCCSSGSRSSQTSRLRGSSVLCFSQVELLLEGSQPSPLRAISRGIMMTAS